MVAHNCDSENLKNMKKENKKWKQNKIIFKYCWRTKNAKLENRFKYFLDRKKRITAIVKILSTEEFYSTYTPQL